MNISGIRPSDGFYDNNNVSKIRRELGQAQAEERVNDYGRGPAASVEISDEGLNASKKQVVKAVKDMEQDTPIHRYQYFVKNKINEEVTTRGAENFTL